MLPHLIFMENNHKDSLNTVGALVGLVQWLEHWPTDWMVSTSIPVKAMFKGVYLGCRLKPCVREATHGPQVPCQKLGTGTALSLKRTWQRCSEWLSGFMALMPVSSESRSQTLTLCGHFPSLSGTRPECHRGGDPNDVRDHQFLPDYFPSPQPEPGVRAALQTRSLRAVPNSSFLSGHNAKYWPGKCKWRCLS